MPNQNDKSYPFFPKFSRESSGYESIEDPDKECFFNTKTETLYSEITKETGYIDMAPKQNESEYIVSDFSLHDPSIYANPIHLSENNPKDSLQKIDQRIQEISNLKQKLEKEINRLKKAMAQLKQRSDYLQRRQEIACLKQCLHPTKGKKDEKNEVDSLRKLLHLLEEDYYNGPDDKIGATQALEIAQIKAQLRATEKPAQEINKAFQIFSIR